MEILLVSYGISEYDGRLYELIDVSKKIGDVKVVSCGIQKSSEMNVNIVVIKEKSMYLRISTYMRFLIKCINVVFGMKNIDILFVDNLFAAFPALIIKILRRPTFIVQDVRELYFYSDAKSFANYFLLKTEAMLMKKANVVLCANKQRAEIMQEYHKLKVKPLVYENIRFLTDEFDVIELDKKYENVFKYRYNIVATGGLSISRLTDKLVYAMKFLPNDFGLFLIGTGTSKDRRVIESVIQENNLSSVVIIDKVPLGELRYILQKCDIGIVSYHKNNLNNKYCASGKVYEYLAEGLPIVTTENIPLKEICETYNIGIADDCFYNGIITVANDLEKYKQNAQEFIANISPQNNNESIANEIVRAFRDRIDEY